MITLGQASNYSAGQVWRHLWAWGTQRDLVRLRTALAERYHSNSENVLLYHTGRSALTAALKSVKAENGQRVIIPGLTCIAVVRAVKAAGCTPVFVDIEPQNLEYNYQKLEAALQNPASQNPQKTIDKNDNVCYNRSIILIQNTLGLSWNMQKIEQIAAKYDAVIVEDLAHSAGRFYPDGREVGTVGAAVALSFGKGKAIDTISGGAAILRQPIQESALSVPPTRLPRLSDRLRDRWYPVFGALARAFGSFGCKMMGGLVKIHFVQRSADAELDLKHRLTCWQAKLAYRQLQTLPKTPLRQFELVRQREEVLSKWREQGYYLDEIWYDTPVSPKRYYQEVNFPEDDCPETVKIAEQIVNYPTWYSSNRLQKAKQIAEKYHIASDQASLYSAKPVNVALQAEAKPTEKGRKI